MLLKKPQMDCRLLTTPSPAVANSGTPAQKGPITCFLTVSDSWVAMQTKGVTDLLMAPAKLKDSIPNISGTRNLSDNISDLKAQVRCIISLP